jgi:hypothetical protein
MLTLVKRDTLLKLLDLIRKYNLDNIKNDNELSNIVKSLLDDYCIKIDFNNFKNTDELCKFIIESIDYYQNSETVYTYFEKDMFSNDFDIQDNEWKQICYHLNKCIINGIDENRETIIEYLEEGHFKDEDNEEVESIS